MCISLSLRTMSCWFCMCELSIFFTLSVSYIGMESSLHCGGYMTCRLAFYATAEIRKRNFEDPLLHLQMAQPHTPAKDFVLCTPKTKASFT